MTTNDDQKKRKNQKERDPKSDPFPTTSPTTFTLDDATKAEPFDPPFRIPPLVVPFFLRLPVLVLCAHTCLPIPAGNPPIPLSSRVPTFAAVLFFSLFDRQRNNRSKQQQRPTTDERRPTNDPLALHPDHATRIFDSIQVTPRHSHPPFSLATFAARGKDKGDV